MLRVSEISSHPVRTVSPDESLDRAIGIMEEAHVRHLPVVRGAELVGMLSERDVLTSVGGLASDERRVPGDKGGHTSSPHAVSEVMSRKTITLPIDAFVRQAARLVVENKIGAVPLLKDGRLEAIVSESDLLRGLRNMSVSAGPEHTCHHPIGEHMTTRLITVSPRDELDVGVRAFREKNIRHLPVLEDDELVGMVSDRDIRRALGRESALDQQAEAAGDVLVGRNRIRDIMSDEPVVVHPNITLAEAAHLMLNEHVGSLAVVEDNRLVGIITETDLVRVLAEK